jgi:anti-anti-sigma factor
VAGNAPDRWVVIQAQLDSFEDYDEPIAVDLSSVSFIDSSGVGLLLRALKYAATRGARLSFINPSPAVTNVLRVSRLEAVLLGTSEPEKSGRLHETFAFLDQVKAQFPSFKLRRTGL